MILTILFTKHILELLLIAISGYITYKTLGTRKVNGQSAAFNRYTVVNLVFQVAYLVSDIMRDESVTAGAGVMNAVYVFLLVSLAAASYCWFVYVEKAVDTRLVDTRAKEMIWAAPLAVYAVLCIMSTGNGWIFSFDGNGKYALGSLFFLQYVFCFGYAAIAMARSAHNFLRSGEKRDTDRILFIIMLIDLAAVVIQLTYMVNMMPVALTATALLAYMNVYTAEIMEMRSSLEKERITAQEEEEHHRETELQLQHEQLRKEVANYMIDHENEDPIELLKQFAERIRVILGCDQVIYRDLEETRIMVNSPAIEKTWSVPIEFCRQCQHFDAHHPMYRNGYTEMDNCQEGWEGIPVYHECPIKSSLTRIVYCDGEVAGYLAIHFVTGYHHWTDIERSTLEEFTRILSMSLSRYKAMKENRELRTIAEMKTQLEESNLIIGALSEDFGCVNYVELSNEDGNDITVNYRASELLKKLIPEWESESGFSRKIKLLADNVVYAPDREQFLSDTGRGKVLSSLARSDTYFVNTRLFIENEIRYYQVKFSAIREAGKVVSVVAGLHSVDEETKREMEEQAALEEALREAQVANEAKTSFLFNMSHDIRTPMNAILGYTDMAIRHLDDGDTVRDSLQKIKVSGGHLLKLINDILEMSRIEAGKLELTEEPIDIREAIGGVENMSQALAVPKSIKFIVETGDFRNPYIYSDELHLDEMLINIISNAMKYSNEDGTVKYIVNQTSDAVDGTAWYRVTVEDNGIGMSEEFLEHIFEDFAREKSTTVSRQEGSGLGLSIVKRIVDLAGGRIDIKSRQGEGTTVTVDLPFKVMDDAAIKEFLSSHEERTEIREDASLAGKRVLLVEDNVMNREIAEEILTEAGLSIETAEDGDVAVEAVREKGSGYYDFILMDIQMPRMNGYEATAAIRRLPGGGDVPIIAVSANAFEEDRKKSLEAGMDAHIAKPIDIKMLFAAMERLADR